MNLASWVTVSRMFLLLPGVLPVAAGWSNGWFIAGIVAALAGLTDVFDGFLARRIGQVTSLGTNLDLLSDKVFIGAMFVLSAWFRLIPAWIPVVVVLRDVIISLVRAGRYSNMLAPDVWGKTKTAVSFMAIVVISMEQAVETGGILASAEVPVPLPLLLSLATWLTLTAVVLTIFSGTNYLVKYFRLSW